MQTAKEIAAALKSAAMPADEALDPLHEHARRIGDTGAPLTLHMAVLVAASELCNAVAALRGRLEHDIKARTTALHNVDARGACVAVGCFDVSEQTAHMAVVAAEVLRARREAFHMLLDAFAVLGDRIEATPEERKARDERALRFHAETRAIWMKKAHGVVAAAARAHCIPIGTRAEMAKALADKGIR